MEYLLNGGFGVPYPMPLLTQ
ncbi:hypothetical protein JL09_g6433 [Pichia kudriavzevii]|uniref:Uncharacterized protein n=1 Tax=Pichia kudriavzevii TaxID=4909 RepID=A0A099NPK0_PICKU|nr:hypothetical protein JL09_g6433 [Pichia kudriavzevii]